MSQTNKDGLSDVQFIRLLDIQVSGQIFFILLMTKQGLKKQLQVRVLPPRGHYAWCLARAGPWSLLPQLSGFTWDIILEISFVVSAHSHSSGAVSQWCLDVHALECPTAVLLQSQPDKHGWSAA